MRRAFLLALFVAIVAAGAYYVQSRTHQAPPAPGAADAAAPVLAAIVQQKPMPVQIETVGRVQAISTVAVRSRIDGVIRRVAVDDGQQVKAGDLLFELDDQEAQADRHGRDSARAVSGRAGVAGAGEVPASRSQRRRHSCARRPSPARSYAVAMAGHASSGTPVRRA